MVQKEITPDILRALRDGDHDAYDVVYLHYSTPIKRFLSVLLRSEEDAKELTQNVFLKLWEKREIIDPTKSIKSFLYNLAKFYAYNHFDHKKVKEKYENFAVGSVNEDFSAEEILIDQETAILIDLTLHRMPAKRRKVFEMSRKEGYSNDDIADKLKISKRTVETHISTALKEIKEVILMFLILTLS